MQQYFHALQWNYLRTNTRKKRRNKYSLQWTDRENMEALAVRGGGADKSTRDKPVSRCRSQYDVIRHSFQEGLPMNDQVTIVDGNFRSHRHCRVATNNCSLHRFEMLITLDTRQIAALPRDQKFNGPSNRTNQSNYNLPRQRWSFAAETVKSYRE